MTRFKIILLLAGLGIIGGTAGMIARLRSSQVLEEPGLRVREIPGTNRVEILFPEAVLNTPLIPMEPNEAELTALPADTSMGRRGFESPDGFGCVMSVVLMGADRTSIHRPQYCLTGQGWTLDSGDDQYTTIPVLKPHQYDLPVRRLIGSKDVATDAGAETYRAVFVYWFVAKDRLTNRDEERMWSMTTGMLMTGRLQRWAYVACYSFCRPGEEEATYERMAEFIGAAAPEIQTTAGPAAGP